MSTGREMRPRRARRPRDLATIIWMPYARSKCSSEDAGEGLGEADVRDARVLGVCSQGRNAGAHRAFAWCIPTAKQRFALNEKIGCAATGVTALDPSKGDMSCWRSDIAGERRGVCGVARDARKEIRHSTYIPGVRESKEQGGETVRYLRRRLPRVEGKAFGCA